MLAILIMLCVLVIFVLPIAAYVLSQPYRPTREQREMAEGMFAEWERRAERRRMEDVNSAAADGMHLTPRRREEGTWQ